MTICGVLSSSGTRPMPIVSLVKFNSPLEISDNVQLYRRAAHTSKVLRLADIVKGDQGAIARRDPLPPPPRDVLQKTVYVEGLPKDATIQWLQNLIGALSRHKPSFVSVPRLRTGHSRGFAFLEFASQSHAASVAKDLNAKKAQSTAFFLQSSRRKLFHNQMRLRQLQTLGKYQFCFSKFRKNCQKSFKNIKTIKICQKSFKNIDQNLLKMLEMPKTIGNSIKKYSETLELK